MGGEESLEPLEGVEARTTLEKYIELHKDDMTIVARVNVMRSRLYAIFGEHEKGASLAIEKGNSISKSTPGYFLIMSDTFFRAISLYVMAIKTKRRKFKNHAMAY